MRLDTRFAQALNQPHAVNHAGGARYADDQFHRNPKTQNPNPKTQIHNPSANSSHTAATFGFGAWNLGFGIYIRVLSTGCFVVSGPVPSSAARAAYSSASTTTDATTAGGATPACG